MLHYKKLAMAGLLAGLASFAPAYAQDFPTKEIQIVLGTSPGGLMDPYVRLISDTLQQDLGYSAISEYKPGASGMLAASDVAGAKPDGYTLWLGSIGPLAINPAIGNTSYDIDKDFTPVALTLTTPNVLVVGPSVTAKTAQELIAQYKDGKRLTFASGGVGGSPHMAAELFRSATGLNLVHVPYKAQSDAITDIIGGRVDIFFASISSVASFIEAGSLRPLLVTSPNRSELLPDVPTADEAGLPGFHTEGFIGFMAPAGTPKEIVDKLNFEINKAMMSDEGKKLTVLNAGEASLGTPEEFGAFLQSEKARWSTVIKENNLVFQ